MLHDKLFELIDVDAVLLRTDGNRIDENFYYFSGLSKTAESSSLLLLRRGKMPLVMTNVLEYKDLKKKNGIDVILYGNTVLKKSLKGRVGINYSSYTMDSFHKLKKIIPEKNIVDVSAAFGKLRETKSKDELNKIKTACIIAEDILGHVSSMVKPGMAEKDLAAELSYMASRDADGISFPTIAAAGRNSAVPHHVAGRAKIKPGILLVDFGVIHEGYCSDITRCFFLGSKGYDTCNEAYSKVYRIQRETIESTKPGAKSDDIFRAASTSIEKSLGQKLIHSIGHGIGINVHDFPQGMNDKSSFELKENMCLTVEPGFYRGFGIRIEDVLIVKKKAHLLTDAPKELEKI